MIRKSVGYCSPFVERSKDMLKSAAEYRASAVGSGRNEILTVTSLSELLGPAAEEDKALQKVTVTRLSPSFTSASCMQGEPESATKRQPGSGSLVARRGWKIDNMPPFWILPTVGLSEHKSACGVSVKDLWDGTTLQSKK
jgi:hypothetical protein